MCHQECAPACGRRAAQDMTTLSSGIGGRYHSISASAQHNHCCAHGYHHAPPPLRETPPEETTHRFAAQGAHEDIDKRFGSDGASGVRVDVVAADQRRGWVIGRPQHPRESPQHVQVGIAAEGLGESAVRDNRTLEMRMIARCDSPTFEWVTPSFLRRPLLLAHAPRHSSRHNFHQTTNEPPLLPHQTRPPSNPRQQAYPTRIACQQRWPAKVHQCLPEIDQGRKLRTNVGRGGRDCDHHGSQNQQQVSSNFKDLLHTE